MHVHIYGPLHGLNSLEDVNKRDFRKSFHFKTLNTRLSVETFRSKAVASIEPNFRVELLSVM